MYTVDVAEQHPDRVAAVIASTGQQWTFRQFEEQANRVAHFLRAAGLEEGDRVAFVLRNSLEILAVQAAAERTGLYHVPINWHLTPRESSFIVNDSKARVVVTQSALIDSVRELPSLCPDVEHWLMVDAPADAAPFQDFAAAIAAQPTSPVANERTGRPLPYSSGTTGRPKGIFRELPGTDPSEPVPIVAGAQLAYRYREGLVLIEPAPMYHSAVHSHLGAALRMGGTSIIMDQRFDAEELLRLIDAHKATHLMLVPTMMARMLQLPDEVKARYDLSSLEAIVHGAAPCPPSVKHGIIEWFGPIVWENFGSTEANGACIVSSEDWLAHPGTVGKPLFGEPVILDADGNELPTGEIGEIWWRGDAQFEYVNSDEKPIEARDATGPLTTVGDVGYVDAEGFVYPTDRASFMIIRGGVNIYPVEVENVLVEHPAVVDVAVFGIPHPDLGEAVQALVELRPDDEPSAELEVELKQFCSERLARFKIPASIDFVHELPRLATGKVQKKILRAQYAERATAGA